MRALVVALLAALACEPAVAPASASPPPAPAPAPAPAPKASSPATAPRVAAGVEYLEFVTGKAGPEDSLPMLVAIHGLGDRPDNFSYLLSDLPFAARVIVPRGLDVLPEGGYSWFPVRARSSDVAGLARGIAGAGDRLALMLRELVAARPTQGKPVVTGFSQGGMLSFYLAVYAPDVVAAAVPVGGWLPPPLWPVGAPPERAPRIVALHGEADAVVRFDPTREAVQHLQQLGWPADLKSWPGVGHALPAPIRRELHHQLGRALPPGSPP